MKLIAVLCFILLIAIWWDSNSVVYVNRGSEKYTIKAVVHTGSLYAPPRVLEMGCTSYTIEDHLWVGYNADGDTVGIFSDLNCVVYVYNNELLSAPRKLEEEND